MEGWRTYMVSDRTTFYKFAERIWPGRTVAIFAIAVIRLLNESGVI